MDTQTEMVISVVVVIRSHFGQAFVVSICKDIAITLFLGTQSCGSVRSSLPSDSIEVVSMTDC